MLFDLHGSTSCALNFVTGSSVLLIILKVFNNLSLFVTAFAVQFESCSELRKNILHLALCQRIWFDGDSNPLFGCILVKLEHTFALICLFDLACPDSENMLVVYSPVLLTTIIVFVREESQSVIRVEIWILEQLNTNVTIIFVIDIYLDALSVEVASFYQNKLVA